MSDRRASVLLRCDCRPVADAGFRERGGCSGGGSPKGGGGGGGAGGGCAPSRAKRGSF